MDRNINQGNKEIAMLISNQLLKILLPLVENRLGPDFGESAVHITNNQAQE